MAGRYQVTSAALVVAAGALFVMQDKPRARRVGARWLFRLAAKLIGYAIALREADEPQGYARF